MLRDRGSVVLLFLVGLAASCSAVLSDGFGGQGFVQFFQTAGVTVQPPVNVTLPQIIGLDTVGSSLTIVPGTYTGSAATLTYSWHMIGGSSLGTGTTFGPLTSGMVSACSGSTDPACGRLILDETATNSACGGSHPACPVTTSQFIGPVETALPQPQFMIIGTGLSGATVAVGGTPVTDVVSQSATNFQGFVPVGAPIPTVGNITFSGGSTPTVTTVGEGALNLATTLPQYPKNFIQNGHGVPPGCAPPPAAPTFTTGTHVWYFDGVTGGTQTGGATGHLGSAFKDPNAIFTTTAGYNSGTAPLFPTVILPGDTIYIKGGQTYSPVVNMRPNGAYSTSTGAAGGTPEWTWVLPDPSSSSPPVLAKINVTSSSDIIFRGLNTEDNSIAAGGTFNVGGTLIAVSGGVSAPAYDIHFENISGSANLGHSNDPWTPSHYPTSGGHSDGTIQTAGPYVGNTSAVLTFTGAADLNATKIYFPSGGMPNLSSSTATNQIAIIYAWPGGDIFYNQTIASQGAGPPTSAELTGISPGTKFLDYNGITGVTYEGSVAALPGTVVLGQGVYLTTNAHFYYGCQEPSTFCPSGTSLVWADQGLAYMDIGPCDTTADVATGCPTAAQVYHNPSGGTSNGTPFVNCDPLVVALSSGGCAASTAPAWNGTTRALGGGSGGAGEPILATGYMVLAPAGAWSFLDWSYAYQAVNFAGQEGSNNIDPANPNDTEGEYCTSVKDSTFRDVYSGLTTGAVHDDILLNNRVKFITVDGIDIYSDHRTLIVNNLLTDFTYQIGHPDIIQFATGFGSSESSTFYGDAAVENEGYTATDNTDLYQNYVQSISDTTDDSYSNLYLANNIGFNSLGPTTTAGVYNVVIQNDILADGGSLPSTNPAGFIKPLSGVKNLTNQSQPQFSLVANNITNAVNRDAAIRIFTVTGTGFGASLGSLTAGSLATPVILSWSNTSITADTPGAFNAVTPAFTFTLTGVGFGAQGTGSAVSLNGVSAPTITAWSNTSITGLMPAGALGTLPLVTNITVTIAPSSGGGTTNPVSATTSDNVTVSSGTIYAVSNSTAATNCLADQNTVEGNLVFPAISSMNPPAFFNSNFICGVPGNLNGITSFVGSAGPFTGQSNWSLQDWRTEISGANSPFVEFHPLAPAGVGGIAINVGASPCLQNGIDVGACGAVSGPGVMNLRPNPSFVPGAPTNLISGGVLASVFNFPTSGGSIGDQYIEMNAGSVFGAFAGLSFPPGLYTLATPADATMSRWGSKLGFTLTSSSSAFGTPGTVTVGGAAAASITLWTTSTIIGIAADNIGNTTSVVSPSGGGTITPTTVVTNLAVSGMTPFQPPIVAGGTNLGINGTPANHARQPMTNPPNVGVY